MGVEVMEMVKKAMKAGLTVRVGPALRALFRGASGVVEVQALVSRQAIDKAERWGWDIEPTHLAFTASGAPTLAFGEEGPTTLSPDDVLLGSLVVQGLALETIRHFLTENEGNEKVALHFGPSGLSLLSRYLGDGTFPQELEVSITAHDSHGYDRVKVLEGGVSVESSWGEASWWDAWAISPEGEVEYVGTVDGPRYLPRWLVKALEDAKAKGM
jgi:hypothetical protein